MHSFWADSLSNGRARSLYLDHFQLRKRIFIDGLRWRLNSQGDRELDQYDTPWASYCLVESNGKLAASARVLPTDVEVGPNSYMIRDTYLGRLDPDLPPSLCLGFTPPVSPDVWEATRLAVDPELPKSLKKQALKTTIDRIVKEAQRAKIKRIIAIGGVELALGARTAGYTIRRVTPYQSTSTGAVAIFQMRLFPFLS